MGTRKEMTHEQHEAVANFIASLRDDLQAVAIGVANNCPKQSRRHRAALRVLKSFDSFKESLDRDYADMTQGEKSYYGRRIERSSRALELLETLNNRP
ncbi:MAG: hypothetical protein KKC50_08480 [Candidatus Omnitrophica bacterium]|nr:hypothetical protein [Candidatus Omnitrophota bacterium]